MKPYRDLIKNQHRVVYLNKMSAYEFDKADLCAFVSRFTTKYPDSDITEQLNEIICKDCDCWDGVRNEEKKRMDIVKELLYSAWKVSYKSGNAYVENCYIFPYKVSEFNGYLFSCTYRPIPQIPMTRCPIQVPTCTHRQVGAI